MASTRRAPPFPVYQDLDASFSSSADCEVETALLHALGPLSDASNKHNLQLHPTAPTGSSSSPTKQNSSPPRPISSNGLKEIYLPPPPPPQFSTDSPQKNAAFMPLYPIPAPQQQLQQQQQQQPPPQSLYTQFSGPPSFDQENAYDPTAYGAFQPLPYAENDFAHRAPMKRALPDAALSKDRGIKKQKLERDEPFDLPDPKDMPPVHDDGSKPQHSYAELIGMAILRAPNRRLTLAQIYKWISDHFVFYKATDSGWQNSIRHNLSLNKNFIKQERPKDDPGKGNYWAIKPGEERPFLLGKKNPIRRITNPDGSQYLHGLPAEMGGFRPVSAPAISHFTLAPNPHPPKKSDSKSVEPPKFTDDGDFSSDATIPASDHDEDRDDSAAMPPPPTHLRSSPPPADIGSSPPQIAAVHRRGTPPPAPRFPSTSRSGNRRQKFAGLNDSGYWSSIESSAHRGGTHHLTSDADVQRPRIKKGRAEAAIARMRSSSIDSPSKERPNIKMPATRFPSSSPIRDDHPLTPAVVFKRPAKPPPSVSPNTNLRNHRSRMRALLGTPAKLFTPTEAETTNWSPAFHLGEDGSIGLTPGMSPFKAAQTPWKGFHDISGGNNLFNAAFDVFIDAPDVDLSARGSPEKRSARRPSLVRAATSTGILADITGSSRSNFVTLAPPDESPFSLSPFLNKRASLHSPARFASPLKQSHLPPETTAAETKWLDDAALGAENIRPVGVDDAVDLFGVHIPSDGSEEAIDIFQDFGKIGQASSLAPVPNRADGSPVKRSMLPPSQRPGLQRHQTSRW